jgi:hypothetical protein
MDMQKKNIGQKMDGVGEHSEMLNGLHFGLEMDLKDFININ